LSALGMMLMASAGDLIIVFLGLETMSISLYVLAGFFRTRLEAGEASMKYLLIGAFASGFFLYGIALIFGATGTTNLDRMGNAVALAQLNLKRMLAYSSIAHVGYMLVGVVAGGAFGNGSVLFYLLVYTFTTAGAFGAVLLLERAGHEAVNLADFGGLAARHP